MYYNNVKGKGMVMVEIAFAESMNWWVNLWCMVCVVSTGSRLWIHSSCANLNAFASTQRAFSVPRFFLSPFLL